MPRGETGEIIPISDYVSKSNSVNGNISVNIINETGVQADATVRYVSSDQLEVRLSKHSEEVYTGLSNQIYSNQGVVMTALNRTTNLQRQRNA